MDQIIRAATRSDLRAVIGLLADDTLGASRDTLTPELDPAYEEAFAAIESAPHQKLVVMEQGGQIVGCLQISYIPGLSNKGAWRGQIEGVRIARDRRGQGLGQTFLQWAIEECRQYGCGVVQLTTDASRTDAQRFYKALGFKASHVGMKLKL